ncbi:hypothetical protein AJ80_02280 [Polytolypa hystricis UAMH7299]|uniref:T6SS Phospholipase effector Tle1-like catalytic domain-containing protein n=1 Tax=Polytolypa hystricis (strain UAMH7299) TaxID=1447883 RepID=A0A2B7YHW5_POLH7|nr:hypothetical protein AJ80_02280 [Polytolypa hystricis UAMH7299]
MNGVNPHRERRGTSPRRLVLCFDGTGNQFQANESDTNVVKIFDMLDRFDKNQFHYYQRQLTNSNLIKLASLEYKANAYLKPHTAGIGTFDTDGSGSGKGVLRRMKDGIDKIIDQAIGTTFEYHVCAGYKFLMRFYSPGDAIYIFGFSRGAYTARFLAEMIHTAGLLSQGNEDMVRFAFSSFSEVQRKRGKQKKTPKEHEQVKYLESFKRTFCRPNVQVHFLGLFDCVNSVGQFDVPFRRGSYRYIATPPAKHIRHAVSIHERRLKFKPALFLFEKDDPDSDIKEVWFAGNHCDVGGGFHYEGPSQHLLSDIPLAWMVDQATALDDHPAGKIAFDKEEIKRAGHLKAGHERVQFPSQTSNGHSPHEGCLRERQHHDFLKFNRGASWFATSMWWIIEILPLFTRLELENGEWIPRYWPPNFGALRDIPSDARIHTSVQQMHKAGILTHMPKIGGDGPSKLRDPLFTFRALGRIILPWKWKFIRKSSRPHTNGTNGVERASPTRVEQEQNGSQIWSWGY